MSTLYKGFLYAIETMVFSFIMVLLYITIDRNTALEKVVNQSVDKKINISSTFSEKENADAYQGSSNGDNPLYVSGGAVISEILSLDDSITVQVNSTILNDYETETGEAFFAYVERYGLPEDILGKISVTRQYRKECVINSEGRLMKVEYILQ